MPQPEASDEAVAEQIAAALQLAAAGNLVAALQRLGALLPAHAGHPDLLLAMSRLSSRLGDHHDALSLIEIALAVAPEDAELQLERAGALERVGRSGDAILLLRRLTDAWPSDPRPGLRLSYLFRREDDFTAAQAVCRRLLVGFPALATGWVSQAIGDYVAGRFDSAETGFQRALAIDPLDPVTHFSRASNLLCRGAWREGLAEFAWRRRLPDIAADPTGLPLWTGREPPGTRVLLWNDQGLGDALQFLRYVRLVAARGHHPVLQLAPELVRLAATTPGAGAVLAPGEPLPVLDAQQSLIGAAEMISGSLTGPPADMPYLFADPAASRVWAARLQSLPGLKVGLVWAGARRRADFQLNAMDRKRSIALARLGPLLSCRGVSFISLQKDGAAAELATLPDGARLLDVMAELRDFADTAALVATLDLVISVDTSVVHLAGALGKPVWVLSRFDGCWRWMRDRDDSPWYPSARIFRQHRPGDWDDVVRRVTGALQGLAG